jgi:signal transduction histidine kinase
MARSSELRWPTAWPAIPRAARRLLVDFFAPSHSAPPHPAARAASLAESDWDQIRENLHDSLAPTLATIAMRLDATLHAPADEGIDRAAELRDLGTEISAAIAEIRRLIRELAPPYCPPGGLEKAVVEWTRLAEQAGGRSAPRIDMFFSAGLDHLTPPVEQAAYRIVLEALVNVVRHSGARHCRLTVERTATALRLEVIDDGHGMSAEPGGLGLRSMGNRAHEVGGRCTVGRAEPRGTRVLAHLPLPAD